MVRAERRGVAGKGHLWEIKGEGYPTSSYTRKSKKKVPVKRKPKKTLWGNHNYERKQEGVEALKTKDPTVQQPELKYTEALPEKR